MVISRFFLERKKVIISVFLLSLLSGVGVCGVQASIIAPRRFQVTPELRVSLLTDRLFRVEYTRNKEFHDYKTSAVVNRGFDSSKIHYSVTNPNSTTNPTSIWTLRTEFFEFSFDTKKKSWKNGFKKLELRNKEPYIMKTMKKQNRKKDIIEKIEDNIISDKFVDILKEENSYGSWNPNDAYKGNLYGTIRTMDHLENPSDNPSLDCEAFNKVHDNGSGTDADQYHCSYGVISMTGIALLDDTGMPIYDPDRNQPYPNPNQDTDIYLFAYGLDFPAALNAFKGLSGAPPLVPKHALGIWFTRWYGYDDEDYRKQIQRFVDSKVPLDVNIWDMNWHTFGDWGGYSWNTNLIPNPKKLTQDLLFSPNYGLHLGLNLHDADGMKTTNTAYEAVKNALNEPDLSNRKIYDEKGNIKFRPANATYLEIIQDVAVNTLIQDIPSENHVGLSLIPWTDYQQGEHSYGVSNDIPKLNPTIMLNRIRGDAPKRMAIKEGKKPKRSLILSRYGGIGSHRYPVGFAGDQAHTWAGLKSLPEFTSAASNILFGYWSHDIYGGKQSISNDAELSTRWIQYGVLSPIFRMHDKGEGVGVCADSGTCSKVEIWDHPRENFDAEVDMIRFRGKLLPYLYTAAKFSVDTGISIIQPLYYKYPNDLNSYKNKYRKSGYFFGPYLLVYPVCEHSNIKTGMTKWESYLPEGSWYDIYNGKLESGPIEISNRQYLIDELPFYQRSTKAIPLWSRKRIIGGAEHENFKDITWQVIIPSKQNAHSDNYNVEHDDSASEVTGKNVDRDDNVSEVTGEFYEDDGENVIDGEDHQSSFSALVDSNNSSNTSGNTSNSSRVKLKLQFAKDRKSVAVSISEIRQGIIGNLESRRYKIQLMNFAGRITSKNLNSLSTGPIFSYYCQETDSTFVDLGKVSDPNFTVILALEGVVGTEDSPKNGFRGAIKKLRKAKTLLDEANVNYGVKDRGHMISAGTAGVQLMYLINESDTNMEDKLENVYGEFWENLTKSVKEIDSLENVSPERRQKVKAMVLEALTGKSENIRKLVRLMGSRADDGKNQNSQEIVYM